MKEFRPDLFKTVREHKMEALQERARTDDAAWSSLMEMQKENAVAAERERCAKLVEAWCDRLVAAIRRGADD